jgi:hypothetical protein
MSLMQVGNVNLYMKTHFIKIPCWFQMIIGFHLSRAEYQECKGLNGSHKD